MAEYIVKETGYPGTLSQEVVGELIRCKDCVNMQLDTIFHDCWCSETGKKVWLTHYCGYAERKEGGVDG